jgi:hypothetical protein
MYINNLATQIGRRQTDNLRIANWNDPLASKIFERNLEFQVRFSRCKALTDELGKSREIEE